MAKKTKVPAEIKAIRQRRARRRVVVAGVLWLSWVSLYAAGFAVGGAVGQALINVGFALCLAQLAVSTAAYEWALRRVAGRPQADYAKIHKLEQTLRKDRVLK